MILARAPRGRSGERVAHVSETRSWLATSNAEGRTTGLPCRRDPPGPSSAARSARRSHELRLRLDHSRIQTPLWRIASYMASGARSAPFGHWTAPISILALANSAASRNGSNTVPSTAGLARKVRIRTSPSVPSTKVTRRRLSSKTSTEAARHGTLWRTSGATSAVRSVSGDLAGCIASSPLPILPDAVLPIQGPRPSAFSGQGRSTPGPGKVGLGRSFGPPAKGLVAA